MKRLVGCCNICSGKFQDLCPHEMGGYLSDLLFRFQSNKIKNFNIVKPVTGINNCLKEFNTREEDIFFLDEINLRIGRFKILKLKDYAKRGHNAISFFLRDKKNLYKNKNILLVLLGADHNTSNKSLDYKVNRIYESKDLALARIACLAFARSFIFAWPNQSLTLQLTKDFLVEISSNRVEYSFF